MIAAAIESITGNHIHSLVANKVREGRRIEYKQALPGNADKDKKEFLADVSSFANASGGDLIFGVMATNGVPIGAPGLRDTDLDKEMLRLDSMLRDAIAPRILGIRMQPTEGLDDGPGLLVRIPRSWSGPHMVTFGGTSRFFARSSAGKFQMDVDELRSAFALSGSLPERIRTWRDERVGRILGGDTPIGLHDASALILHIVPFDSVLASSPTLPATLLSQQYSQFPPIGTRSWGHRINLDGTVWYAPFSDEKNSERSYCQVFRNGRIEAVHCGFVRNEKDRRFIPSVAYEKRTLEATAAYLRSLLSLSVTLPMTIMVSMVGVRGAVVGGNPSVDIEPEPIDRDLLLLPDVTVESFPCNLPRLMRPIFDAAWNASGIAQSLNYDGKGKWLHGRLEGVPTAVIK